MTYLSFPSLTISLSSFPALKKGTFLGGHFDNFTCFGVSSLKGLIVAVCKTAKSSNFNTFIIKQGTNHAFKANIDNGPPLCDEINCRDFQCPQ